MIQALKPGMRLSPVPDRSSGILLVFRPGVSVLIGESITGTVLQVTVGEVGVQYQVAWWDGNTRRAEWLNASEVGFAEGAQLPPLLGIGFHAEGGGR